MATQAVGFLALDMLIPGKLADHCFDGGGERTHPAAYVTAGIQLSAALVICAALT